MSRMTPARRLAGSAPRCKIKTSQTAPGPGHGWAPKPCGNEWRENWKNKGRSDQLPGAHGRLPTRQVVTMARSFGDQLDRPFEQAPLAFRLTATGRLRRPSSAGRTSTRTGSEAPMPSHLQPARVTDDRVYRDERFRLVAPPAGPEPRVTAEQALRLFAWRAVHSCTVPGPP